MPWWLWVVVGLVFLVLEVQTLGSFFLMFFGLGALLVGALVGFGIAEASWLQWLLFSILSVVTLVMFRQPIMRRLAPDTPRIDDLLGEIAIVAEDIPHGGVGKVELRGTVWNARHAAADALAKDVRCRVERVEGLLLWVRPE